MKAIASQLADKKPPATARRSRRRYATELMPGAHREMISQFEVRGPDSDIDIAEAFATQRPSVVSVLVHELFRRLRRVEHRQATGERTVSIDARKGIAA